MWGNIWDTVLEGDFLLAFFQLVMALLITIVNLLLFPFSLLVQQFLPDLNEGLIQLTEWFDIAGTYMAWVIDAFAIPGLAVGMIAAYYLFTFSVSFTAWTVKLIIKWKQALWA